jgi:uncharacterized repeat protein (TIGR03803 family)
LISDGTGNLYGTTIAGGGGCGEYGSGTVFKIGPDGSEKVLYAFAGCDASIDGCCPNGALVSDNSGNLYGTTYICGTADKGTVFKVQPNEQESVLYSVSGGSDGSQPEGGLIIDASGNLYGRHLEEATPACSRRNLSAAVLYSRFQPTVLRLFYMRSIIFRTVWHLMLD